MLTKEEILGSPLKVLKVPTPEWKEGEHVFVRILSGPQTELVNEMLAERARIEKESPDDAVGELQHMAKMCCIFVCDEAGNKVLEVDEAEALFQKAFVPIQRCVFEGLAFNHMTEDTRKQLEEDLKKTMADAPG